MEVSGIKAKKYIVFREKVDLTHDLSNRAAVGFVTACGVYSQEREDGRKVQVCNVSRHPDYYVPGTSIIGLTTIEARKGDVLEVHVEGSDKKARDFAAALKKGLSEDSYLSERFMQEYQRIMRQKQERDKTPRRF